MAARNVLCNAFEFFDSLTKGARKFGAPPCRYLYERNVRPFYFDASLGISPVALLLD